MWQINEDEHIPIKCIKCHAGCLCCACVNKSDNDNLKKQFSDTVMCFQENGNISNKNLFGFQMTKKTADEHYQPRIIYLTPNEIRQLYKDPKSIWEESQKWVGDTND